jgi:4-diphosphocytidyl-2-C-methyl-D-erythritol kinase
MRFPLHQDRELRSDLQAAHGVEVLAPAKINLFLHVGEKRDDGYHALESLVAFAETADRMDLRREGELSLQLEGPFAAGLARESDNLVLKVARALRLARDDESLGAAITLHKNLPVAAGVGGGSADAAAAMRALNLLWKLEMTEAELVEQAALIGSDVPACVLSQPCWMTGRGERVVKTAPLPALPMILVNPGVAMPTARVFAELNARSGVGVMQPPPAGIDNLWDLVAYLGDAGNDLEAPACRLAPVIDQVLSALDREPGCALAQMSGSGSTCFAMFHAEQFAIGAAERLAQDHPEWWVRVTHLAASGIGAPRRID